MIRFRFTEDEKRYLLLIGEVYRLVAANMPAPAVSHVMRNLGKAQDMLMLEGVRQGLAVAEVSHLSALAGRPDTRMLKAFQAHASVYGSADTPLRQMELEWLQTLGFPDDESAHAWLDSRPMRFAPQTLRAYEAEQAASAAPPPPHPSPLYSEIEAVHGPPGKEDALDVATWPGKEGERLPSDEGDIQERPSLLDQAREVLQKLVGEGYQPGSWSEMIMRLHLIMEVDAGFLDLQMGTEMGRTVLAQCGIHDIIPGRGIDLNEMQKMLSDPEAALALSGDSTKT